jgi:diguanylate cyclase (GGDEF)-like protein
MESNRTLNILLVDDHKQTQQLAERYLSKQAFNVLLASNGVEALECFKTNSIDLILLDVVMPGMDGFEACHAVRQMDKGKHTPIIMMTGLDDLSSIEKAFASGATDFATKPINWPLLLKRMHYILRSTDDAAKLRNTLLKLEHAFNLLNRSQDRMQQLAFFDKLTELPNREKFRQGFPKLIDEAKLNNKNMAVLFLNLDNFKRVNDTFGHEMGDEFIKEISATILGTVSSPALYLEEFKQQPPISVSRFGSDEFVVLIEDCDALQDKSPESLADKITQIFSLPIKIEHHEIYVTTSIGISRYPQDAHEPTALLKKADLAMSHSKYNGKNTYTLYSDKIEDMSNEAMHIETELRKALKDEDFELHLQPKYHLGDRKITGFECLLRWPHQKLGNIPPDKFIPIAESSGLIFELGRWTINAACLALKKLQTIDKNLTVAINLSALQFRDRNLVQDIKQSIEQYQINPAHVEFELTENLLLDEKSATFEKLNELKKLGVILSIDDFGTGYSSFSYLKELPISTLKIDRYFVKDMLHKDDDKAIVQAIIAMSHHLNLQVVAEGVEEEAALALLKTYDCDQAQGYLISRPVALNSAVELLKDPKGLSF